MTADAPERIWITPCHLCQGPDDYFLLHPDHRNGRGTEYVRADLATPTPAQAARGKIIYQHRIYRHDLQQNPEIRYVFGDNVARAGFGGQAEEMRGEHNAIGIATKWRPSIEPSAFFSDEKFDHQKAIIDRDLELVSLALDAGRIVVFPLDGIGTGLSDMPRRAPRTWEYLQTALRAIAGEEGK